MANKQPYSGQVRDEVIRRVKAGESKSSVARDLGIHIETICAWTPEVRSHQPHEQGKRDEAIKRILAGEPKAVVGRSMGIGKTAIGLWTKDIKRKKVYSVETKAEARRRVLDGEMKITVARDLCVSIESVHVWTADIKSRTRLTPEVRNDLIRRVENGEFKKHVADDLGISITTARRLTKHVIQTTKISDDIRQKFIERVNGGETLAEVSRSMNISRKRYRYWITQSLVKSHDISEEDKKTIIERQQQGETIAALSLEFSVPTVVIRVWIRMANGGKSAFPTFSKKERERTVQRISNGEHVKDIAKSIGASIAAVHQWKRAAQHAGLIIIEKEKPKHDDREFLWLSRRYPHLSDWQESMSTWLKGESRGISMRISALALFSVQYLDALKLPVTRSIFLHRETALPSFVDTLQSSPHSAIKTNNVIHHFLNWVLLNYFSKVDMDGNVLRASEFRNPIPLLNQSSSLQRAESVRDVLPYGFIVQIRERLVEGPDFRDWKFAQSALGFETYISMNSLADWYPVSEAQIDKTDVDCVWRLRERLSKPPVLEMWSPVRWVAMLTKLQIPARTGQIRVLDSGESDTWRYEKGSFVENTAKLAHKNVLSPWQQGVFHRVLGADNTTVATLYLNSNKTADALKSGRNKGMECPWPHFSNITENPYYWLEKLRNWQEKYNPIQRRISWAELPATRGLSAKSDAQLSNYPDACFLFRTPESRGEEYMPITNAMLSRTWQKLMTAFELDLAKTKMTHADGSPIVLNNPETGRTYFPPHALRVSLITSLVVDGNISPEQMMKIVGHSRLVMTLYYTKPGYTHLKNAIVGAAEKLETQKDASVIRFLSDASNEAMLNRVVFNAENWQSVIAVNPAHRNPIGWLLMHDGICFAGGNTTSFEGNSRVPGCHNGGALINAKEGTYGPVQGGPMNCSLCRWKAAEKHHVPALVATLNNQLYFLHQEQQAAVKYSDSLSAFKKKKANEESAGRPFNMMRDLKTAERLYEKSVSGLANLAASIAGTLKMIQRLEVLPDVIPGAMTLASAGDALTTHTILQETNSELLQLAGICQDLEIYPDLNPGKAVFRISQLLDMALKEEREAPFFTQLSEADQLTYGNAFMRAIANLVVPNNPMLGIRKVVSLLDKGQSLQDLFGIKLIDLVPKLPENPMRLVFNKKTK